MQDPTHTSLSYDLILIQGLLRASICADDTNVDPRTFFASAGSNGAHLAIEVAERLLYKAIDEAERLEKLAGQPR